MRVYEMLDYRAINSSNVRATKSYLTQFQSIDKNFKTNFEEIVDNYMETEKQVKLTVLSILFPLFVILLIFIYMVSDRIRMAGYKCAEEQRYTKTHNNKAVCISVTDDNRSSCNTRNNTWIYHV